MTCTRFFLTPAGELCAVEEPGRCARFWVLWARVEALQLLLSGREIDDTQRRKLAEEHVSAGQALSAHLEVCSTCRSWADRCQQHVSHPAVLEPV